MQCNVLGEEDKIDVLYGSAEPGLARRVRQHLSACAACREEMAALEGTRERLSLWTLPRGLTPGRPPGSASSWGLPWPRRCSWRSAPPSSCAARRCATRTAASRSASDRGAEPSLRQLARGTGRASPARDRGSCGRRSPSRPRRAPVSSRSDVRPGSGRARPDRASGFLARIEEFKERVRVAAPPRHGARQRRPLVPRRQERPARRPDQRAHELHAAGVVQEVAGHDSPPCRVALPSSSPVGPAPRAPTSARPPRRPPGDADGPRPRRGRGEPPERPLRPRGPRGRPGLSGEGRRGLLRPPAARPAHAGDARPGLRLRPPRAPRARARSSRRNKSASCARMQAQVEAMQTGGRGDAAGSRTCPRKRRAQRADPPRSLPGRRPSPRAAHAAPAARSPR